jgi:uroporphyrinogen decarboxylase
MNPPLTHRQRVRLALDHKETDRVPIATICAGLNEPVRRAVDDLLRRTRGTTLEDYLAPLIDVRQVWPEYVGPALPADTDVWGVRRRPVSYGPAAYMEIDHYPLSGAGLDELAAYPWPRLEWYDYAGLPARLAGADADAGEESALIVFNGNPFETSWYMRGFEAMLEDLALRPEFVRELLRRVTDFYAEFFRRVLSAARGRIDLVFTADDIAGQEGPLLSPAMWREFLMPCHQRLSAVIHEFGARVVYHSDGAVMNAVPGLIEQGIDVLQALQFDARGMDASELKRRHGGRLCFAGGVSVQKTLPFGSADDVREETRRLIRVLGAGGGYILGPSHAVQAGTPPENVLAMFDEAARSRSGSSQAELS